MHHFDLGPWSAARLLPVEAKLDACFGDAWPARMAEACRYPSGTGGKRMRPLLVLGAAEAVSGADPTGLPGVVAAAAAIELVHTYSLVHDDLPCMDDDDLRRGRPTVHRAYSEGVAVLVGDALLTEAFVLLGDACEEGPRPAALVAVLARAAGAVGMIAGQGADIGMGGAVVTLDALMALHRAKTGALIRAAVRMGAICAGADAGTLACLDEYGDALGLAFQIHDDLLDADQDAPDDGPPSFVRLVGREETARLAEAQSGRAIAALVEAGTGRLPGMEILAALAHFAVRRDH